MNNFIKAKIKEHALKDFPNECCGFICVNYLGDVTVLPCENKAVNKKGRFVIDPAMNIEAEKYGHIAAFYHSHVDEFELPSNEKFSIQDLDCAYEACLPALLYVYPQDTWFYHQPKTYKPVPLIGRPFVWGIWDCYSLVREYQKIHKGLNMNYYFPPSEESINANFKYEEFVKNEPLEDVSLDELKEGDIILFKIKSQYINHSAVYLGGNEFLHQPINKSSSKMFLDERYLKYIARTLRYKYE
jgi:proteasome lid subunit RPN8/RPN11